MTTRRPERSVCASVVAAAVMLLCGCPGNSQFVREDSGATTPRTTLRCPVERSIYPWPQHEPEFAPLAQRIEPPAGTTEGDGGGAHAGHPR